MNVLNMISGTLIFTGAVGMFFAFVRTGEILKLLKGGKFYKTWKWLKLLTFFFSLGYLVSTAFILFSNENIPVLLTGLVFFFGAFFVLIVVRASFLTISLTKQGEAENKKLNEELEKKVSERSANLTEVNEKLKLSEEKYRKMVEVVGDVVYTTDYNGYFTYINPAVENLIGYKQNEIIGKHFTDFIAPDWKQRVGEFYLEQFKNKIDQTLYTFPIITKTGEKKWVEQTVIQLREGDKINGHRAIIRDITTRKVAEDMLKDSEERLTIIINEAPDALIVIDEEEKVTEWNPKAELLFGWKKEEVLGKTIYNFIIPEQYREKHLKGFENFLKTGVGPILNKTQEVRAINKNKVEFDGELTVSETTVKGKHIFIAFLRDISLRKKMENKIRESEQFLDCIIENIPSVIFVKEVSQFKYIRLNKAAEELMSLDKKELIGKTDSDYFPKEMADFFVGNDKKAIESGQMYDVPLEPINTKKGQRWLHTRIIPLNDEKGNPKYVLGISEDITEKRKIEEEKERAQKLIRNNELKLRLILENIGEGVAVADNEKRIILSNQMAEEIIGIKQNSSVSNIHNWTKDYELYYPDEKTIFPSQNLPMERALKGESTDDVELIIEDSETKTKRRVLMNGRPIIDENNQVIAAVSTIKDITRYKKLEKELEESEQKYRKLIGFARR